MEKQIQVKVAQWLLIRLIGRPAPWESQMFPSCGPCLQLAGLGQTPLP